MVLKLTSLGYLKKDDLTYIDIAKTFEQTYFVTDYAGGSGDSGALNELTIAFGETMDGMPDIRITVSENGYIQINGKRAYPLSLKYAGKRLYVHLLGVLTGWSRSAAIRMTKQKFLWKVNA